jgi:hypothetical protein
MSTVIRDGIIRISIQQGTVELKAPDLRPIIEQRKQEAAAIEEVRKAAEAAAAAETKGAEAASRAIQQANREYRDKLRLLDDIGRKSLAEAEGGNKWDAGVANISKATTEAAAAEAAELEKTNQLILADRARRHAQAVAMAEEEGQAVARAAEQQAEAVSRAARAQVEMLEGVNRIGSGFLQLGRSIALFTADSDKSLRDLVQTLATFQSGFDLLRGGIDLFAGTVKILEQMQNARRLAAAATTAETAAITANTVATNASAAAQGAALTTLAATNPILLAMVAVLAAAAVAWKLLSDAEKEAAVTAREIAESSWKDSAQYEAQIRRNKEALKDFMSEQEKEKALARDALKGVSSMKILDKETIRETDNAAYLESEAAVIEAAISASRELVNLEKEKTAEKIGQLDIQTREIEQQQRIAEQAQKALEVEEKKVQAFEAQFGALDKGEQKRLQKITDQVRGGNTENLRRSDLEFLGQSGGDQGRQIAQEEFARRGREQGAGNVFGGIANPALDQAAAVVDRENQRLNDLTGGQSVEDALSDIEDEKKQLTEALRDFKNAIRTVVEPMVETLNTVAEQLKSIKQAAQNT